MTDIKTDFFLKNARLSFPAFDKKEVFEGKETDSYGGTFILANADHVAVIKALKASASALIKTELKGRKPDSKYLCLKTNDSYSTPRAEYEDAVMVRAVVRRPVVIGPDKEIVTPDDENWPYSGCYVNARVQLWAKKTKGGPSVGANLIAVQFSKDGEAFDGSYISPEDAIADFEEMEPGDGFDEFEEADTTEEDEDDLF